MLRAFITVLFGLILAFSKPSAANAEHGFVAKAVARTAPAVVRIDEKVAELIVLRQEDERQQAEAEARLEAEQATRAEEDARLRELYPIEEDFQEETISESESTFEAR